MKKKYFTEEEKRLAKNERNKKYRENHKKEISEKKKVYYETHKKEIQTYFQNHKKEINLSAKKRYQNNKEKKQSSAKKYYKNHKKERLLKTKEYYQNNKEEINLKKKKYSNTHKEKNNKRHNDRYKTDINYKLAWDLRTRGRQAIKNNYKVGSFVQDLGCSIPELKIHLESKFQEGMTWDNWSYTGWHIDHIIPLSSFNLQNREEFLKACHYTNLQPLWAEENFSKNDKIYV